MMDAPLTHFTVTSGGWFGSVRNLVCEAGLTITL